jgi:hypothetical protein
MNQAEVKTLLTLVSTLDQRKISDDVIFSWSNMLGDVKPQHAREAVEEHFREKPDTYLNVGHVVKGAKRFAERDAEKALTQERGADESGWRSDPQPVCRDHDTLITECYPCCDVLAEKWFWGVDERHQWAVANLYKKEAGLERV